MDSSRSGLLSTLLMTLPLIVVPAIALLRPPGVNSSVSDTDLGADEEEVDMFSSFGLDKEETSSQDTESDDNSRPKGRKKPPGEDATEPKQGDDNLLDEDFDEIFSPEETKPPERKKDDVAKPKKTAPDETPSPEEDAPLFVNPDGEPERNPNAEKEPGAVSADEIVRQLNAMGAVRTLWFSASEKTPVGFAAFFRGQTELMRYRFEAVGATRDECARDVFAQVIRWQQLQLRSE